MLQQCDRKFKEVNCCELKEVIVLSSHWGVVVVGARDRRDSRFLENLTRFYGLSLDLDLVMGISKVSVSISISNEKL